jgi:hypothetical protein
MDLRHDRDYWEHVFAVRPADLDRIARRIERSGEAHSLTRIARRLIRGRLRYGPERSLRPGAEAASGAEPTQVFDGTEVRLWDPAAAWHEGDLAIFAVPVPQQLRTFTPAVGRVLKIQGNSVIVSIDGLQGTRIYGRAPRIGGDAALDRWRRSIEDLVAVLEERDDEPSSVDYVFWLHGERIVTLLRHALRQDTRFVSLAGDWFLAKLAVRPSEAQVVGLAHALLQRAESAMTDEQLTALLPPGASEGDARRFGLALAIRERPDLFTNVEADGRRRWTLAGPPPGVYTARLAAYDPETYDVLCEPGDTLAPATVRRLWALDLLGLVVGRVTIDD